MLPRQFDDTHRADDTAAMDQPWQRAVDRFCRQYLQLEQQLDFPQDAHLRLAEVQEAIYARLFAADSIPYKPPVRYMVRTLKALVSQIESSIEDWDEHEVSENLMNALATLLATPVLPETASAQQKAYVTYHHPPVIPSGDTAPSRPADRDSYDHITLLENRAIISGSGTTGLRTWEAALHLGRFLCHDPAIVRGRRILELGAGTGYLSILCAAHLGTAHVIASDGSDEVVSNLPDNLFLNGLRQLTPDEEDSRAVQVMDVKWGWALMGTEEREWNGGRPVDVVLAADVTYDRSVIPVLVVTLMDLFNQHPRAELYIAATQRNRETFEVFLDGCQRQGFRVEDIDFAIPSREEQDGPFYSAEVEIKICKVTKSANS